MSLKGGEVEWTPKLEKLSANEQRKQEKRAMLKKIDQVHQRGLLACHRARCFHLRWVLLLDQCVCSWP